MADRQGGFNPRPTRRSGATRHRPHRSSFSRGFNPRPTRRSGATGARRTATPEPVRFQSSPNPKVGRYPHILRRPACHARVSILAQPEGRALRCSRRSSESVSSFQSSPNPKVGRYRVGVEGRAQNFIVSILAQPEGRALLPDGLGGRLRHQFQSSPNPKVGRYLPTDSRPGAPLASFNPRPTRRSGATVSTQRDT